MRSMDEPIRIAHVTDTHLLEPGALHYGTVDTRAAFAAVLDTLEDTPFDALVVSGDISDDGTPASYETFLELAAPCAQRHGALLLSAMGNHDQRSGFAQVLRGQPAAAPSAVQHPLTQAATAHGARFLVLDSSVPRAGYGRIGPEQLSWLRAQLSTPAPRGTVLVVHHPPLEPHTRLLRALPLTDAAELVTAVQGTDVRVILSGHLHHSLIGQVAGIPVVVGQATANRALVTGDPDTERAVVGAGAGIVELAPSGEVRVLTLPVPLPDDGAPVFSYSREQVEQIARLAGLPDAQDS